ncbi:hypothetical protein G3I59_36800 [Amycolatopsis rubida]|uniref:Uncharacterized protein n=1 Tax=Amycolatopsis rubida TaxID=112413 RepID=A0ABX0C2I6_9PSEU|nr:MULTISPECIES: hypothetical protein [Amycolatopsis]MYW96019.1 hypothetical protein [Amycolatopsis rubida]NEC61010.1 hypothetical protein [Amycolatopsis rubida]OAP20552.1 hypothetical protein A4R44_08712 [Amycolatopsis sp. M39]
MIDHNGQTGGTRVWAVYCLTAPPSAHVLVLYTIPDRIADNEPCRWCVRLGIGGPCPGGRAHALAHHARLSLLTRFEPLKVDVFELPPHESVRSCATNLYRQILERAERTGPATAEE